MLRLEMNESQNILIVDDEKSNINILLSFLEDSFENEEVNIVVALSGEKAIDILSKRKIDLILLDIVMPNMDGFEVCNILKNDDRTKSIPILFITSKTDEESLINAFNIGATDYITKPFNKHELLARVKSNLKLQLYIKRLEHFAYFDALTNIYNRRKFFELVSKIFEEDKKNLYAIMFDIDKFKSINDKYGHSVGDIVIKKVANTLNKNLSDLGVLGRLGGEEFAFVGYFDSKEELYSLIESVRMKIAFHQIEINESEKISCTISIGISKYINEKSVDHFLHEADLALYKAKGTGRNKSIFRI